MLRSLINKTNHEGLPVKNNNNRKYSYEEIIKRKMLMFDIVAIPVHPIVTRVHRGHHRRVTRSVSLLMFLFVVRQNNDNMYDLEKA